jgi:hypothetical protein
VLCLSALCVHIIDLEAGRRIRVGTLPDKWLCRLDRTSADICCICLLALSVIELAWWLVRGGSTLFCLILLKIRSIVRKVSCVCLPLFLFAVPGGRPGPDNVSRRFRPAWDGSIPLVTGCSSLCNIVVMEVCCCAHSACVAGS